LGVFAKLFEDRLEWRREAETFSRREIGGYDDVLDFLVGQFLLFAAGLLGWITLFFALFGLHEETHALEVSSR
jgi:hypothetical protein